MNDSFERLLKLSQRTGDTLIVFDKESGNHQVVMDVEKYEALSISSNPPVGHLTEQELIDRLNKDISLWKESQSTGMDEDLQFMPEDPVLETPEIETEVSFDEDSPDWHSAADVLDNIHPEFDSGESTDLSGMSLQESEIKLDLEPAAPEPIEYDPVMQVPASIPMLEQNEEEKETEDLFQEEPLDDEPIFFEEPIN